MTASIEYADIALAGQFVARVRGPGDHGELLESVPADLEGRHQAASSTARTIWRSSRASRKAMAQVTGDKRFDDHVQVRARRQARQFTSSGCSTRCTTTAGYKRRRHHGRQVRPARRRAAELPHLSAHSVLRAGARQRAVLHRHRPAARLQPTYPRRSSTARTSSSTAKGPEATPYLPNVIVSSNPLVRPNDYGIPLTAEHWDERTDPQREDALGAGEEHEELPLGERIPVLLPDAEDAPPRAFRLVERRLAHASTTRTSAIRTASTSARRASASTSSTSIRRRRATWASTTAITCTWMPIRRTGRTSARSRTIRSTRWRGCMLRVKYNHAYPYNVVMMKHAPFIATEKSVKAHETRPDGLALSANTGYQATSASARSSRSRATGTCRCTRPTRCSTRRRRRWASSSAARRTTTPSTPCRRKRWCASRRPRTAGSAAKASGRRRRPATRRTTRATR